MMFGVRILFYSTLACVVTSAFVTHKTVDPVLNPFFDSYQTIMHSYCKDGQYIKPRNLEIKFTDLDYPTIGMCSYNYFGSHKIEIDKTFWKYASEDDRRNVMWHEQTHCFFHVGHVQDPSNYMAPVITHLDEATLTLQVNMFMLERCL